MYEHLYIYRVKKYELPVLTLLFTFQCTVGDGVDFGNSEVVVLAAGGCDPVVCFAGSNPHQLCIAPRDMRILGDGNRTAFVLATLSRRKYTKIQDHKT